MSRQQQTSAKTESKPTATSTQPRLLQSSWGDRAPSQQSEPAEAPPILHEALNLPVHAPDRPIIQRKLTIGPVGDKYEQEADRIAAQVVNQINTPQSSQRGEAIQRQENDENDKLKMKPALQNPSSVIPATPELESAIGRSRNSGYPLAPSIRKPMERAFGADFSRVKVHADSQADQLNQSIQAKAFTNRQDIFFRQGAYQPGSQRGQELIAHELTHVVQQNGGVVHKVSLGNIQREFHPATVQSVSRNYIQRAIGVELECTNLHITDAPANPKKGNVIKGGYQWEMMYETTSAGEPVVEFRTNPAAEFEPELLSTIGGMQAAAAALDKSTPVRIGNYEIKKEGNIEGAPQITIGVPLENLPAVYSKFGELGTSLSYKKYQKLVEDQGDQSEKDPDGNPVKDLPAETKGFILLCIDYIQRGYISKEQQKKIPQRDDYSSEEKHKEAMKDFKKSGRVFIKGMYDVMARTDFKAIFDTLSSTEKKRISYKSSSDNKIRLRKIWINWLIANATRPWDHLKKTFKDAYTEDKIVAKKKDKLINEKIKGYEDVGAGPVRGEWLREMPNEDLLTAQGFMGIGKLGNKTDVRKGDKAKAPIYELRAPENASIDYKKWMSKGAEWWQLYLTAMNNEIIKRSK